MTADRRGATWASADRRALADLARQAEISSDRSIRSSKSRRNCSRANPIPNRRPTIAVERALIKPARLIPSTATLYPRTAWARALRPSAARRPERTWAIVLRVVAPVLAAQDQ